MNGSLPKSDTKIQVDFAYILEKMEQAETLWAATNINTLTNIQCLSLGVSTE